MRIMKCCDIHFKWLHTTEACSKRLHHGIISKLFYFVCLTSSIRIVHSSFIYGLNKRYAGRLLDGCGLQVLWFCRNLLLSSNGNCAQRASVLRLTENVRGGGQSTSVLCTAWRGENSLQDTSTECYITLHNRTQTIWY